MICIRCKGTKKIFSISAKCSDTYYQQNIAKSTEHQGYVPDWCGKGGSGDYVNLTICRHCGQVQGQWPELNKELNQFKHGKAD